MSEGGVSEGGMFEGGMFEGEMGDVGILGLW